LERLSEASGTPWAIVLPHEEGQYAVTAPEAASEGLVLITGITAEETNLARIVDRDGRTIHEWDLDWTEVGPDPAYLPETLTPRGRLGGIIHGSQILPDGSIMFNFSQRSTARVDICGRPVWALENFGHHFVVPAGDGTYWVGSEADPLTRDLSRIPNHTDRVVDFTFQRVNVEGEILEDHPLLDILYQNDLLGLMFLANINNTTTLVGGDTMHMNDIDVFPEDMTPGVFAPGDLMMSLRNINTVIVVDPEDFRIKFRSTGPFLRQHDPEFIDGNRILVFDNRNLLPLPDPEPLRSRIVEIDARTGAWQEVYRGPDYFTEIVGKLALMENGNALIAISKQGQAMEITPAGEIAWLYEHVLSAEHRGFVTDALPLPPEMDAAFFEAAKARC
ncbi:MAG: arylsulfotransferase family protein, partial [Pseudomonadota bacterium]